LQEKKEKENWPSGKELVRLRQELEAAMAVDELIFACDESFTQVHV
jgi:hypothetical protein